jgi:hypothetical protein
MTRCAVFEQAPAVEKDMTRLSGKVDAEYLKRAIRGAQDGTDGTQQALWWPTWWLLGVVLPGP